MKKIKDVSVTALLILIILYIFNIISTHGASIDQQMKDRQSKNVEDKKINLKEIPKVSHLKIRARSDNTVGITFARLGNYSMAIDYFKKAVENDPENVDFKANLAVAYYRTYKYDDAVRYYDQVKKKKPEMVSQLDFIESRGERTPKYVKFD